MVEAVASIVLFLALSALFAKLADVHAYRVHPPSGKFLTVDGIKLHYREEGRGPGVVLLHGNGGLIADMETSSLMRRLGRSHRVIAFDRPGFGHSELIRMTPEAQARLFMTATQQLSAEPVVVVGHSYGALISVAWGLEAPRTVKGLVLVSGYLAPAYRRLKTLKTIRAPIVGPVLRWCFLPIAARIFLPFLTRIAFSPLKVTQSFKRQMPWALILRSDHLVASLNEASDMPSSAARIGKRYKDLAIPVVLLSGTQDMLANPQIHAGALNRLLRHSEIHLVADVGHMLHHARPDIVCNAVARLAASPAPADPIPPTPSSGSFPNINGDHRHIAMP